mmetsp:Transcript_36659/g.105513  ORF Transcript_36659/g.105513 Transcript_36659/m.105513 type:complete len:316 (-) Transcript_36659:473-1420(-)
MLHLLGQRIEPIHQRSSEKAFERLDITAVRAGFARDCLDGALKHQHMLHSETLLRTRKAIHELIDRQRVGLVDVEQIKEADQLVGGGIETRLLELLQCNIAASPPHELAPVQQAVSVVVGVTKSDPQVRAKRKLLLQGAFCFQLFQVGSRGDKEVGHDCSQQGYHCPRTECYERDEEQSGDRHILCNEIGNIMPRIHRQDAEQGKHCGHQIAEIPFQCLLVFVAHTLLVEKFEFAPHVGEDDRGDITQQEQDQEDPHEHRGHVYQRDEELLQPVEHPDEAQEAQQPQKSQASKRHRRRSVCLHGEPRYHPCLQHA